ncbi:MAG: hypothetical protein GY830_08640 [Bacteroidetes bacterium]|nr:hypothetical protein [Bacteroidota bacterium]
MLIDKKQHKEDLINHIDYLLNTYQLDDPNLLTDFAWIFWSNEKYEQLEKFLTDKNIIPILDKKKFDILIMCYMKTHSERSFDYIMEYKENLSSQAIKDIGWNFWNNRRYDLLNKFLLGVLCKENIDSEIIDIGLMIAEKNNDKKLITKLYKISSNENVQALYYLINKMWKEAGQKYAEILQNRNSSKESLWYNRYILNKYSNSIESNSMYAENSSYWQRSSLSTNYETWIKNKFKLLAAINYEEQKLNTSKSITQYNLGAFFLLNKISYLKFNLKNNGSLYSIYKYEGPRFSVYLSYKAFEEFLESSEFITTSIYLNQFDFSFFKQITPKVSIGYILKEENFLNAQKKYAGHRHRNEAAIKYNLFRKPFFVTELRFINIENKKTLNSINFVKFLERGNLVSIQNYLSWLITKKSKIDIGYSQNSHISKNFLSYYMSINYEYWFKNNLKAFLLYETSSGDSLTNYQGKDSKVSLNIKVYL